MRRRSSCVKSVSLLNLEGLEVGGEKLPALICPSSVDELVSLSVAEVVKKRIVVEVPTG